MFPDPLLQPSLLEHLTLCDRGLLHTEVVEVSNHLRATLGSDYGPVTRERVVDYEALSTGRPQAVRTHPDGRFRLFRIGDAVAARNTHAAIHDALRLAKEL